MPIIYKDYELLEIFEDFPQIIDKEALIVRYNKTNKLGFKLSLFMSTFEDYIVLTLYYKDNKYPIYNLSLENIEQLVVKNNTILFYEKDNKLKATILFEPNFSLSIEPQD